MTVKRRFGSLNQSIISDVALSVDVAHGYLIHTLREQRDDHACSDKRELREVLQVF